MYLWLTNPAPLPAQLMNLISNRVALRTFSPAYSREVVGIPDAALITEPDDGGGVLAPFVAAAGLTLGTGGRGDTVHL